MLSMGSHRAYAQVDLSGNVAAASPIRLVQMLYDGALKAIWAAQEHIKQQNVSGKGESITKAIAIVGELHASLNHEVGGEIAMSLSALYEYMTRRLLHANLKGDPQALKEVEQLLSALREAWVEIGNLPEEALETSKAKAV